MTAAFPNDVIQALRQQLAERDAILVDQKGEIDRLGRQVAMLNDVVKGMLATRRRGVVVPAGQGLLFPSVETPPPAIAEAAAAADAEADDGSSDAGRTTTAAAGKKGTPRTPRKLDLVGLPSEDRVHDVAEAERVDPVTGKPLRKIGETVFEELDYQRAQLRVIRHVRPIYGPSADDGKLRDVPPVMADLPPRPLEGCAASAGWRAFLPVEVECRLNVGWGQVGVPSISCSGQCPAGICQDQHLEWTDPAGVDHVVSMCGCGDDLPRVACQGWVEIIYSEPIEIDGGCPWPEGCIREECVALTLGKWPMRPATMVPACECQ